MKKIQEDCICAEFDGKGFSTCGFPCPAHFKGDWNTALKKRKKAIKKLKIYDRSEDLYDCICMEIGFGKKTEELRGAIKAFGRERYNAGFRRGKMKWKSQRCQSAKKSSHAR